MRTVALVLAALLAVPAALVLLRPVRPTDGEQEPPRRALDGLWAVVPLALLLVLIGFAAAA